MLFEGGDPRKSQQEWEMTEEKDANKLCLNERVTMGLTFTGNAGEMA